MNEKNNSLSATLQQCSLGGKVDLSTNISHHCDINKSCCIFGNEDEE